MSLGFVKIEFLDKNVTFRIVWWFFFKKMAKKCIEKLLLLTIFSVFLWTTRLLFFLRKHYRFCRSTNCVDWRLTLWFHRSQKKEKERKPSQKSFVLGFASCLWLLVKKMSYFCLQEMHGRLGPNFFAAIISSQQCWKKMYATEETENFAKKKHYY